MNIPEKKNTLHIGKMVSSDIHYFFYYYFGSNTWIVTQKDNLAEAVLMSTHIPFLSVNIRELSSTVI